MNVIIKLQMPEPGHKSQSVQKKPETSIEQDVSAMLWETESDGDSAVSWKALIKLYKQLESIKKPTPQQLNIMKMIHPALSKYGYHCALPGRK